MCFASFVLLVLLRLAFLLCVPAASLQHKLVLGNALQEELGGEELAKQEHEEADGLMKTAHIA